MIRIFFRPKILQFNISLSYNFSKTLKKPNNFMGQNDKWMGQNDKWMRQNDKWTGQKTGQNDNEIASAVPLSLISILTHVDLVTRRVFFMVSEVQIIVFQLFMEDTVV